ncbi:MAG: hypothetical protein ACRDJP_01105, partial [Actinomycetota bacterium]
MSIASVPSRRRVIAVCLVAIVALLGALVPSAASAASADSQPTAPEAAPDRLIVHGARPPGPATQLGPDSWVVEVDPEERDAARRRLARQPGVERVELDTAYRVATDPNDPCYGG